MESTIRNIVDTSIILFGSGLLIAKRMRALSFLFLFILLSKENFYLMPLDAIENQKAHRKLFPELSDGSYFGGKDVRAFSLRMEIVRNIDPFCPKL